MQSLRISGAFAAIAVLASGAAYAQTPEYSGEARLVSPATAPQEAQIDGVAWRCDGEDCAGSAKRHATLDGLVRQCKKVVAVIGPVASYKSRGRELTASQIRACNRGAIKIQTASN